LTNQNSWIITGISYALAIGIILLQTIYNYQISEQTWNLITVLVGTSTAGGIINGARKHYLKIKQVIKDEPSSI
jgi:hypothetical protein